MYRCRVLYVAPFQEFICARDADSGTEQRRRCQHACNKSIHLLSPSNAQKNSTVVRLALGLGCPPMATTLPTPPQDFESPARGVEVLDQFDLRRHETVITHLGYDSIRADCLNRKSEYRDVAGRSVLRQLSRGEMTRRFAGRLSLHAIMGAIASGRRRDSGLRSLAIRSKRRYHRSSLGTASASTRLHSGSSMPGGAMSGGVSWPASEIECSIK